MKIIVTGGAGFIGSHLTERLLSLGHDVTVVDNLSTGRLENLSRVKEHKGFRFLLSDIRERNHMASSFVGVDWVFHLAALADIVPSIEDPTAYHENNVDGTVAVLELARAAGAKRFVYAASSSCYGIPKTYPTPETAEICPEYPYALSKNLGEQCVLHWAKVYGLPAISLRLFNAYGPRVRTRGTYGAVFGVFLAQKLQKKPFTVVGDGSQSRDFTFVDDIVDAFLLAADSSVVGDFFNVGSGQTVSVNRLVELLGGEKVFVPKRPGEPDITFADISKIKLILNWSPKTTIDDGVKAMLKNIQQWSDAPVWTPESIEKATEVWFRFLSPKTSS